MKSKPMKKEVGVWIDHREAIIVIRFNNGEEVKRVESTIEEHVRDASTGDDSGANNRERRGTHFNNHLTQYYDDVVAAIRSADSILILGPSEARFTLQKRLEGQDMGKRIVGFKTVDKMTDEQLVADVQRHFQRHFQRTAKV